MSMKAGQLRHEITIESNTRAADDMGQRIASWSTFGTIYAKITNLSGNELMVAKQVNAEINTEITIRWFSGLRSDMRVKATIDGNTRYYNIININTVNEIEETVLLSCKRLEDNTNG